MDAKHVSSLRVSDSCALGNTGWARSTIFAPAHVKRVDAFWSYYVPPNALHPPNARIKQKYNQILRNIPVYIHYNTVPMITCVLA